jgi:predicted Zn-dependent protease
LARDSHSAALLITLADLRDFQGRYEEAEALYRQVLLKNDKNIFALNNLAWLLAMRDGRGQEALALINRAIDQVGPSPELLDTRGVIYLRMGQTENAIRDLEDALSQSPSASRYYHLAQARHQAKDRARAVLALREAKTLGLSEKSLHPLERSTYKPLTEELGG